MDRVLRAINDFLGRGAPSAGDGQVELDLVREAFPQTTQRRTQVSKEGP